jgi:DNA-binding CsgD family transcriptional regulator
MTPVTPSAARSATNSGRRPVTAALHARLPRPKDIVTTLDLTPPTPLPAVEGEPLTVRERVVLAELGDDVTLEQVARRLYVSRNTVKSQVRSIYRKIGVSTRAEAVAWARAAGIG